ncbi:MAG: YceI family protein [Candidatus Marinimicrobia bacterium]|jgi:polyisoprenoid-binding protein YceI|nr:YceI family protein [Candidatus Neomarinimicrobiota bacterium]MDP6614632.1 YceI family protein [Candidatus Neomarinimicrobiota bacterium]|tara:strand:- start:123 stop:767 length:645 start_codon:yes stop_codon:yes gene_type:complete
MKFKIVVIAALSIFLLSCAKERKKPAEGSNQSNNATIPIIREGNYTVNVDSSTIKWTGKEITTDSHYGTLGLKQGAVEVSTAGIVSGNVVVDMNSIQCLDMTGRGKTKLEGHLRSDDFFGVQSFPEAALSFTSLSAETSGEIHFTGDLTIKNITHPITFSGLIHQSGNNYSATINFSFDRTLYDVKYRSGKYFKDLGDKLILDDIDISAKIAVY